MIIYYFIILIFEKYWYKKKKNRFLVKHSNSDKIGHKDVSSHCIWNIFKTKYISKKKKKNFFFFKKYLKLPLTVKFFFETEFVSLIA